MFYLSFLITSCPTAPVQQIADGLSLLQNKQFPFQSQYIITARNYLNWMET
jgi:hypothetical protein